MARAGLLHHVEIYVSSLESSKRFWGGFLARLGYEATQQWPQGATYKLGETYITFVQTEAAFLEPTYHRKRVGLNHLAFHAESRAQVDSMTEWLRSEGHHVLYNDRHPFAGGENYYAVFFEDPDRIKVELVAPFND